ncbi:MAG TPA: ABC transporter substrate-binding protein [Gemmatimonadales bacterium]|nr:ABC transporter substrate-binding protein [Gemmatimonadales bacterium]
MTRWTRRFTTLAAHSLSCSLLLPGATAAALQQSAPATSIVIVTGQDAPMPIPTLMEGPQANQANFEIADHLFLRLASLGRTLLTAGDQGFVPQLARAWVRRDSVTLAFELDPRARWHDGTPVTARDVLFTFGRARDPAIAPRLARLLRSIAAVEAEGHRTVVVRFTHPYAEQVYDAVYHVAPLPAHLLATIPPEDLRRSSFVSRPVGNGPYRWVRNLPGELIELAANEEFFLGRPGISRVLVRVAADADARLNLVLSGEADAMDNIPPPPSNLRRVSERGDLRLVQVPSPTVGYLLYNLRDPRDRDRPHAVLADTQVRRALTLALDRRQLVRAVLGRYGEVPFGPVSPLLWIRHGAPSPRPPDRAAARRLLAERGWADRDGDGVLERHGRPLSLTLTYPGTSGIRRQMALLVQEQWRGIGVRLELVQLDAPLWVERRTTGAFDIDFSGALQDPSPSGLTQSWSCRGGGNVSGYCDPVVDSLLDEAIRGRGNTAGTWHTILRRIEDAAPAAFLYAPIYVFAVHRRYQDVTIRPESSWMALWRWSVRPEAAQRPAGY